MNVDKEKYIKILKLELNHLNKDISRLIDYEKQLHENNTHTNYVYLENLVVLKDEIMGLNGVMGHIDKISPKINDENYAIEINNALEEFIKSRGYPLVVLDLIQSKLKKIEEIKEIY